MAATDQQILPLGTSTVPASWPLPSSLELVAKAVFASFDGTGAAGSFLPTLTILSDSGDVIGRYDADTAVAAGDSADTSWAPFLKGAAAAAATVTSATYLMNGIPNTVDIASGTHSDVAFRNHNSPESFYTFTRDVNNNAISADTPVDNKTAYTFHSARVLLKRTDNGAVDPTLVRCYIRSLNPGFGDTYPTITCRIETGQRVIGASYGLDASGFVAGSYSLRVYNDDPVNSYTLLGANMFGFRVDYF